MQKMLDLRDVIRETLARLPQRTLSGAALKYEISYSYDEDMWMISASTSENKPWFSRRRTYISDAVTAIRMEIEKVNSESREYTLHQRSV